MVNKTTCNVCGKEIPPDAVLWICDKCLRKQNGGN